ncbi:hypothetical protein [Deinococcus sp. YIM 77859]|uniref:hypothetical protein n=1 Tax=Deinococcus sp. YIM 77859 TaxID=1540221 RepID=UPI00055002B0|nr:hypothetical protein [Deinococcus sp. YIM 77859]
MTFGKRLPGQLKLSREMKLLLVLLLILTLSGGIAVWNAKRHAADLVQTPPASDEVAGTGGAPAPPASSSGGTVTQPSGAVEVPSIPAFGQAGSGDTPPTPSGINPDTPLAAIPSVNPFRPLALEKKDEPPAQQAASITPEPQTPGALPSAPLNLPRPTTASPVATAPRESLTLSPLPQTPERVTVERPAVNGAPFPPSTTPSPASEAKTEPVTPPQNLPAPSTPLPAPVRPPAVALSVPREPLDLGAGKTDSDAAAADGSGKTALPPATVLPTPGTPKPITQLGAADPAASTSDLDRWVQSRGLSLASAVLGPVNTAILHSPDGFFVVSTGQTLPDSDVTVREVTAESVTLARGNDTTTLNLEEKR